MNSRFLATCSVIVFTLSGCALGNSTKTQPPSANPITVIQAAGHNEDSSSLCNGCASITVTLPNSVSNGDLIGVVLWWNQANPTATSVTVTDSQNNNYTNVAPNTNFSWAGNTLAYGFYARNVAGGSNFTVTASTNPGNGYAYYMAVVEAKNASAFDQWVAGNNCTNAQGCTTFTTNPFQVTHGDTLLVGLGSLTAPSGDCQGCGAQPVEAGPGFTLINDNVSNHVGGGSEYLVITTPGQYNGVFTVSSPANDSQLFFAFY